jgi:predicted O-methyltransferase YrrM
VSHATPLASMPIGERGADPGRQLGSVIRSALEAPLDRHELESVVRVGRMRRRIVTDPTPVSFDPVERAPEDISIWPVARDDGAPQSVGRWVARSAVAEPFGRVLFRVARAVGGAVVELGTGSGLSAAYLACGIADVAPSAMIVSVEPHPVLARRSRAAIDATFGVGAVHVVQGAQEDLLDVLLNRVRPRVVHVDSDHTVASMSGIMRRLLAVDQPTVVCLDDIRWSSGMERIWDDLCRSSSRVSALFDLHLWGVMIIDPEHRRAPDHRRLVPPAYTSGARPAPVSTGQ